MTKSRALFWLVAVLSVLGGAMTTGLFGNPQEVAKWFLLLKWIARDRTAALSMLPTASWRTKHMASIWSDPSIGGK